MSADPVLRARIRHSLPGFALDIHLDLGREIGVLFGPSGSGKTVTLRLLAGLLRPYEGEVILNGMLLSSGASGSGIHVPPQKRRIGFVFQHQALFPHMTVLENIVYGARGQDKTIALAEARRIVELPDIVGQLHLQVAKEEWQTDEACVEVKGFMQKFLVKSDVLCLKRTPGCLFRLPVKSLNFALGDELDQIFISGFILGQKYQMK